MTILDNAPDKQLSIRKLLKWEDEGRKQDALLGYQKMLELAPDKDFIYWAFAEFLSRNNKPQIASKVLDIGLKRFPDDINGKGIYARVCMDNGKYRESEQYFKDVLAGNPDNISVWQNYALLLRSLERFDEAVEIYLKALKLFPKNIISMQNLLSVYFHDLGDNNLTLKLNRELIKVDKNNAFAYLLLAECLFDLGMIEDFKDLEASSKNLDDRTRGVLTIIKCLMNYLQNPQADDAAELESFDLKLGEISKDERRLLLNSQIFKSYLVDIYKHKKLYKKLFSQEVLKEKNRGILFVGDSHILPIAHMKLADKQAVCKLNMGCKAFHLSRNDGNRISKNMLKLLAESGEYFATVISVGEIDCRNDVGFIKHFHRFTDVDKENFIADIVKKVVNFVKENSTNNIGKIYFMSVPAPVVKNEKSLTDLEKQRVEVVKMFNKSLKINCKKVDFGYIDTHQATEIKNLAIADKSKFLDENHVKSKVYYEILSEAFEGKA